MTPANGNGGAYDPVTGVPAAASPVVTHRNAQASAGDARFQLAGLRRLHGWGERTRTRKCRLRERVEITGEILSGSPKLWNLRRFAHELQQQRSSNDIWRFESSHPRHAVGLATLLRVARQ